MACLLAMSAMVYLASRSRGEFFMPNQSFSRFVSASGLFFFSHSLLLHRQLLVDSYQLALACQCLREVFASPAAHVPSQVG
mmetsp:Transcript_8162/g.27405  ORF Transcript_8162/g.27405 Transcript_8162/m.27405 type:complete len:81 (+) Transcript_8162:798-1040(+)